MRLTSLVLVVATIAVGLVCVGAPASAHETHSIAMANYAFAPSAMTIEAGDTVAWTNSDQAPHDVMVTSGPAQVHSPMLAQGQRWSFTFTTPGTYHYVCSVHPDMVATLTVTPHSTPTPTPTQTETTPPVTSAATQPTAHATSHPASHATSSQPEAATASTTAAAVAAATPPSSSHPLKPLLLLAGLVAAIATFCLLLLAARPDEVLTTQKKLTSTT